MPQPEFLPTTRAEMDALGWDAIDILLVSGDAYVDSHSFGVSLLGRWLLAHGFRAGIVAQPRWDTIDDISRLGRPRLFAGVAAGAVDSLLAHYTAFRKKRHDDAYSPGGKAGLRPNRATIVYTGLVKQAFSGLPVAAGGIEASLRRASHYDFWSDSLRRSILLDAKADVLLYGMAEKSILELAELFSSAEARQRPGAALAKARIAGSVYAVPPDDVPDDAEELPSHEAILAEPTFLIKATMAFERQMLQAKPCLVQRSGGRAVVFEPPAAPLTTDEMDKVYGLPFSRKAHPSYTEPVPATAMLEGSVVSHRGCGGGCSFCALASHQGRLVQSRSERSILSEVDAMAADAEWKGSITDIGGPSSNMWGAICAGAPESCKRESCLYPKRCRHFKAPQAEQADMLRNVARRPGVKHVRVASGVRHDLALENDDYLKALVGEFTGGQLKIAPEHVSEKVLRLMRKTPVKVWETFLKAFDKLSKAEGKEQYVVPYLMSAFPGCTDADMEALAAWLKKRGWRPQQVQCFIPTPGTVATAMFHAKTDIDGNPIPVARTDAERLRQHRILMPEEGAPPAGARRDDRRPARRDGPRGRFDKKPFRERTGDGPRERSDRKPFREKTGDGSRSRFDKKPFRKSTGDSPRGPSDKKPFRKRSDEGGSAFPRRPDRGGGKPGGPFKPRRPGGGRNSGGKHGGGGKRP